MSDKHCKCGCGTPVSRRKTFVDKQHQLRWMHAGGASEMNALLPEGVRERGGHTAGSQAAASGRLTEAGKLGGQKSREIAEQFRQQSAG